MATGYLNEKGTVGDGDGGDSSNDVYGGAYDGVDDMNDGAYGGVSTTSSTTGPGPLTCGSRSTVTARSGSTTRASLTSHWTE